LVKDRFKVNNKGKVIKNFPFFWYFQKLFLYLFVNKKIKTYKVKFIFFRLYKSIEVTAASVDEAEKIVCEKYSIPKALKKECKFKTTFVK